MNKIFIYISLIFTSISFSSSPKWYIETVDNTEFVGDSSSIKIDSKGYPHISYNEYNYDGELRYAYFDGTKWNIEIVDSKGDVGECCSIAIDSKDNPHISYCDFNGGNEDLKYAYFDGTKWNIEVVDSEGRVGWYSSIAIDKNNQPHISYTDMTNNKPKYAYFDGTKWNIEVIDPNSNSGRCTSIALDKEGNPHVAYTGVGLKYAYKYQSNWVIEEVDNDHIGGHLSLALDSNDLPHISYCYWNDYGPERLMYAYFYGNEWHKESIDEGTSTAGGGTSIALDKYDFPHISYNKHVNLGYARYGYGLSIDLTSFTAKPNNDAITLNWSVSTDEDISGFNLYRREMLSGAIHELPLQTPVGTDYNLFTPVGEDDNPCPNTNSQWTKVNTSLITGTNPYSYTDRDVLPETTYEYKLEAVVSDKNETLGTTSVNSGNGTPASFNIVRIYPTPADDRINIDVVIPSQSNIDISIYDIAGRKVSTIAGGQYNMGEYKLASDVSFFANGVYIVIMTSEGLSASKNFVVAR
jgi:hypothetical protein